MTEAPPDTQRRGWRIGGLEILLILAVLLVIGQRWLLELFDVPALQTAATVFVSIFIQALPFLVLGVLLSAAIAAFVPPSFWARALPRNRAAAVPVAGACGLVLPGCECASVPVAGSLMSRGVTPAAALAFLLSAPAINPIVLASTYVAFPDDPMIVVARLVASFATAIVMGWLWLRFGKGEWLRMPGRSHLTGATKWHTFRLTATHDFLHAGGFLVVGGLAAAVFNVAVPQEWLETLAENPLLAVLALALLAVVLSICSEADAFVAASFTEFSPTAKLAFMVVGPMVDLKLMSMQAGVFGRAFAARFAPTTFVVAVAFSVLVGWWLLS
jgi:uncharacterized protein